ncbi:MAG: hypothetical protein ABIP23_11195 [Pelobium sp.]
MKNIALLSVAVCLILVSCKKKEFEDYYARPDNLADPIYQQLQAKGNFTSLLKCIDKAGYKESLSSGGYWTFFAADDEAFKAYLLNTGMSSVDQLDSVTARQIVTYNLVYNAYTDINLLKYQSPSQTNVLEPQVAFKRKTAYYDFVYTETVNGKPKKVINTNRNSGAYTEADNGNKYIPYFLDAGLAGLGLTANDYTTFYQNSTFGGFNIAGSKVTEKNVVAENGIIHIVDKVNLPPQNIDGYITSNDDYSEFKRLLNLVATYNYNDAVTKRYQALSKKSDSVFVKGYNPSLAFAPNNENFLSSGTDGQIDGYTMFIPRNAELKAYTKNLLTYYGTFEAAPPVILYDFLNAHMFRTSVWPNKINSELNASGETATFAKTDIFDKKVLSNGLFYGIKSVQDADVFRTLYGKPYLNPAYTLMTRALDGDGLKSILKIPAAKYTIFMMSNLQIRVAGYDYYEDQGNWGYLAAGTTGNPAISDVSKAKIFRILETSVLTTRAGELNNLSGKGIVEAYNGEYVKYNAGKVYASGNEETNTPVTIDSLKDVINGRAYYTKGLLTFTEQPIPFHIEALSKKTPANFSSYWQFLSNSPIYAASDKSILKVDLGAFYTFLIPTNAAITQAVKDGVLPGNKTTGVPNFKPTASTDIDNVQKFIYYHILDKNTVVSDGKKAGAFQTLLKNNDGDVLTVTAVSPSKDNLSFRDSFNKNVSIDLNNSNNLSNRTVIHSLNAYLKYNDQ